MTSQPENSPQKKDPWGNFQLFYGIVLILTGLGVIFRLWQGTSPIESFGHSTLDRWFIRFCFYFVGIILMGGGIKKVLNHFKESNNEDRKER